MSLRGFLAQLQLPRAGSLSITELIDSVRNHIKRDGGSEAGGAAGEVSGAVDGSVVTGTKGGPLVPCGAPSGGDAGSRPHSQPAQYGSGGELVLLDMLGEGAFGKVSLLCRELTRVVMY